MRQSFWLRLQAFAAICAVGACVAEPEVTTGSDKVSPSYLGIKTVLLAEDMVRFELALRGSKDPADLEAYGRCAAAQYALIRGAGFARHIRTNVTRAGAVLQGDAVYLISAALPRGTKTIDAEVTVRDCGELGIPTV